MAHDKPNKYAHLSEGLSEHDVFARSPHDPTAGDLFTVPFAAPEDTEAMHDEVPSEHLPPSLVHRMTHSQTVLLAGIVLVVTLLGVSLMQGPRPRSSSAQEAPNDVSVVQDTNPKSVGDPNWLSTTAHAFLLDPEEPLSLALAESLYKQMAFEPAYRVYHQLHEDLLTRTDAADFRDFLILRMALCAKGLGQAEVQSRLMQRAAQSGSPTVRVWTRYHQSLDALRTGQLTNALTWAYQALALTDALSPEAPGRAVLKRNCRFLICQATTRQALALHDADREAPEYLWLLEPLTDSFQGLTDTQVQALLTQGQELFEAARLGPRIQMASGANQGILWQAASNGASVDELLNRFGANAHIDVSWSFDVDTGRDTIEPGIRKRPVHLLMSGASAQEIVEMAAGSVRLFAEIDAQGTVRIIDPDPTICPSLVVCSQQWTRQALALWQHLILNPDQDLYVPNAHFALGLLREAMNRPSEAIGEYRLLADRYSRSKLAPHALLRASRIKTNMRDYLGAREDLKLLVDQYPDVDFSEEAVLYLAQATLQGGLFDEAYRLFMKANNQAIVPETRRAAAWGAGQCSFASGFYDKAARWIVTYIDLTERKEDVLPVAILLLGKVFMAMGQYDKACDVFQDVLTAQAEKNDTWEALQLLVRARIAQDKPVEALHVLMGNHLGGLTQDQENEMAILQARVYRSMGLIPQAASLLNAQLRLIPERQRRADAYYELGACALVQEDYQDARRSFSEVLVLSEAGPLSWEATVGLARASLMLNNVEKAQALCRQVLSAQPPAALRSQAQKLLSETYLQRQEYEQAAQILLQQLTRTDPNAVETAGQSPAAPSTQTLVSKNG